MTEFAVTYSWVDRLVHTLAMGQFDMQKALARIEDRGFDKAHPDITAANPIFITSLPRAGTTLLLEIIAASPDFAAHTYRDMPLVLCPLTWDRLSRGVRTSGSARERAHGDGMLVSYDSVEAFEEISWRGFWPGHFEADRIRTWKPDESDEEDAFAPFLRQHMRKIIALNRERRGPFQQTRYVSKNNANIARLEWLERHFPDCTIVIPYREPLAHIASLHRQHINFLKVHETDRFTLRYMETIGHFEFGKALRPIDFDSWLASAADLDPTGPDFWATYWIAAFEAILCSAGERTLILSYDRLCARPTEGLTALESLLGIKAGALCASASRFRKPTEHAPLPEIAPERSEKLKDLVQRLDSRAVV